MSSNSTSDEEQKKAKKKLDAQLMRISEHSEDLLRSLDSAGEAKRDISVPSSVIANANSTSQAKNSFLNGKPLTKKQNTSEEIYKDNSEAKKRFVKIILILFASIGSVAGLATYQEAKMADEYLEQATSILSKGLARNNKQTTPYLLRVIGFANSALKLNPNSDKAYGLRARAKAGIGKPKQAIDDATKAISLNTRNWDAFFARANALYDLGDEKSAIADYSQAIAINPQYAAAYKSRASAKYAIGDMQGALGDYSQAIVTNPNDAEAIANRANARLALNDSKGACIDYNQAASLGSKSIIEYLQGQSGAWCRNMP